MLWTKLDIFEEFCARWDITNGVNTSSVFFWDGYFRLGIYHYDWGRLYDEFVTSF